MRSSCTSPRQARGELHDFDLGAAEPLRRRRREAEEPRVPRHFVIVDPHHEAHPAIDVPLVGLVEETAADVAQVLADLRFAEVLDPGVPRPAVVPGDAGRLLHESGQHASAVLRVHGLGAESDPEPASPVPGGGRAMGPRLAGRGPDDQDDPIVDRLGRQDGLVGRIEPVAVAANPLLRRFELRGGQTAGGQGGASVPLPDADDDVASVEVVIDVRERADRP